MISVDASIAANTSGHDNTTGSDGKVALEDDSKQPIQSPTTNKKSGVTDALSSLLASLPSVLPSLDVRVPLAHRVASSITRQHHIAQIRLRHEGHTRDQDLIRALLQPPQSQQSPAAAAALSPTVGAVVADATDPATTSSLSLPSSALPLSTAAITATATPVPALTLTPLESSSPGAPAMSDDEFKRQRALWKAYFTAEKKLSSGKTGVAKPRGRKPAAATTATVAAATPTTTTITTTVTDAKTDTDDGTTSETTAIEPTAVASSSLPPSLMGTDVLDHLLRSGSTWTPAMLSEHLCGYDIAPWPVTAATTPSLLPDYVFEQIQRQISLLLASVHGSPLVISASSSSTSSTAPTSGDDSTGMASLSLSNESSSRLFLDAIVLPIAAHCGIVMDVESTEKRAIYPTNRRDYVFGISPLRHPSPPVLAKDDNDTKEEKTHAASDGPNEEKDSGSSDSKQS